jgi:hypothetical protein
MLYCRRLDAPDGYTRAVYTQELHTALSTLSARDAELRECREQVGTEPPRTPKTLLAETC